MLPAPPSHVKQLKVEGGLLSFMWRCLFGHRWDGCLCTVCHRVRDTGHNWGECECAVCHRLHHGGHEWDEWRPGEWSVDGVGYIQRTTKGRRCRRCGHEETCRVYRCLYCGSLDVYLVSDPDDILSGTYAETAYCTSTDYGFRCEACKTVLGVRARSSQDVMESTFPDL